MPDAREAALVAEFAAMGMPRWWLEITAAIGFDNALAVWRIMDMQRDLHSDDGLTIRMRRFSSYQRFQRNRFIEALGAMGLPIDEIRRKVKKDLGEEISVSHIYRLARPSRITP
nr:hypothetical protein [uncultured Albidiferax sp.]